MLDVRFPPPDTVAGLLKTIRELLGESITCESLIAAEPTHFSPDPLYCEVTEQITGQPINRIRASGGSDARFIRAAGIPVILSRPAVGNLHAEDEWIDIDSMVTYYRICETYVGRKLGRVN